MDFLRFYDRIGERYDWFDGAEARSKEQARLLVKQAPGYRLLNVGTGTGKEHARLQEAYQGKVFGLDRSAVMARLSFERSGRSICQADARCLPYASGSFDVVYSAYVLDMLPSADLASTLSEFRRVLCPGGHLVLLALTEGVNITSRALVKAWKAVYALSPIACGGCRPLQLSTLVLQVGFRLISQEVIVQFGIPSEIILARKEAVITGV